METLEFKVVADEEEAKAVWEQFSPHKTIDDEWDFRDIWTREFSFPFHFIVGYDRDKPVGLLPLTLNTVKGLGAKYLNMHQPFLEFFGGIDIDDTRVWVVPEHEYAVSDFLRQITMPAKLTYLQQPYRFDSDEAIYYLDRFELDLRPFPDISAFMRNNLDGRSRQRLGNRLRRIEKSYTVQVKEGTEEHLETLFQLNIGRFGERSSFHMEQRRNAFRAFLKRFDTDLFCIHLDREVKAVSMSIVYNTNYTTLSIGYDINVRDLSKYLIVTQMKRAMELGCTKFDAGKGDNGSGTLWACGSTLFDFARGRPPVYKRRAKRPSVFADAWCKVMFLALVRRLQVQRRIRGSGGRHEDVLDIRHVAPGGRGGLLRGAPALASVHVCRVPVPPVVGWGDCLVRAVTLGGLV